MKNIKKTVRKMYGQIATQNTSCCGGASCCCGETFNEMSKKIGYSDAQLANIPSGANLGLGCGNPLAIASIKPGNIVLDLGSGAGFDSFLASRKVGETGKVIGVDMTDEMLNKARENAVKGNIKNVEFRKGDIEDLPVDGNSIDVIISNCVINLALDKEKVFKEAFRVLKPGGRIMISDVVLSKELPEELKNDDILLARCVSGAILKKNYVSILSRVGFSEVDITKEIPMFLDEYALSITFSAVK